MAEYINTKFHIVVHYYDDFFMIEKLDDNYFCFRDLLCNVYGGLRLDCEIKLKMEGHLPNEKLMEIVDDSTMLTWFKENGMQGEDYLHLFVSLANAQLDPFTEDCSNVVSGNSGKGKEIACEGTKSDDEDYQMSDEGNVKGDHMWARHAFDPRAKSDHITNNMSKSFNHWIGMLRGKPVLTLIEALVLKLTGMVHDRYQASCFWENPFTPNATKKIDQMRIRTSRCNLVPSGRIEFVVTDNGKRYPIDLKTKQCICNYWQISGLPCRHALTCMTFMRLKIVEYCDGYFTKTFYQLAYSDIIHPVPDISMVDITPENSVDQVLPPVLKRLPGQPRRNRKKEVDEAATRTSDVKRLATLRGGNCKEMGYNKRTCQRAPTAAAVKKALQAKAKKKNRVIAAEIIKPSGSVAQPKENYVPTSTKRKARSHRKVVKDQGAFETNLNKQKQNKRSRSSVLGGKGAYQ